MKGKIQKTYTNFSFSHQKYWIIDDTTVYLSTGKMDYTYNENYDSYNNETCLHYSTVPTLLFYSIYCKYIIITI